MELRAKPRHRRSSAQCGSSLSGSAPGRNSERTWTPTALADAPLAYFLSKHRTVVIRQFFVPVAHACSYRAWPGRSQAHVLVVARHRTLPQLHLCLHCASTQTTFSLPLTKCGATWRLAEALELLSVASRCAAWCISYMCLGALPVAQCNTVQLR